MEKASGSKVSFEGGNLTGSRLVKIELNRSNLTGGRQFADCLVKLFAEGDAIELVEHGLVEALVPAEHANDIEALSERPVDERMAPALYNF